MDYGWIHLILRYKKDLDSGGRQAKYSQPHTVCTVHKWSLVFYLSVHENVCLAWPSICITTKKCLDSVGFVSCSILVGLSLFLLFFPFQKINQGIYWEYYTHIYCIKQIKGMIFGKLALGMLANAVCRN